MYKNNGITSPLALIIWNVRFLKSYYHDVGGF
jgi:hypothetical protein